MTIGEGSRNDLHLTSTGQGHGYKDNLTFPPVDFKRSLLDHLPAPLCKEDISCDFYITTTGSAHDYKSIDTSISRDIHKKAPGHWDVDYVEDTIKKLQVKPQRRPLAMSHQSSEMKSQFMDSKNSIPMTTKFSSNMPSPIYYNHHTKGLLKSHDAPTEIPELYGQKYNIQDRGVFDYHGDLYLSTTKKDHRSFTKEEKSKYPRKEYGTYWECEGYPKAWGHGTKHNPLPIDYIPREKGPMRDHTWFKTSTVIPRIPKQLQSVPCKGMCSEVTANFTNILEEQQNIFHCPVSTPWDLESPGQVFSLPNMYKTEYQSIASGKPVMV